MKPSRSRSVGRAPRSLWCAALLACVALVIHAPAGGQTDSGFALKDGSRLWLDGTSTLHAFTSKATQLQVRFAYDTARWPGPAATPETIEQVMREGGVTTLEVAVPVTGMRSGKDGLDRNMQKTLKAPEHPAIRFRMERYEVVPGSTPEEFVVNAHGSLTVAGAERPVELAVTARRETEGIRLRGTKPLLMSAFDIRPPKMMMGTVRTGDRVTISFDLLIAPVAPPAPSAQR